MDKTMAFLQKYIGGFFSWWEKASRLPTIKYVWLGKEFSVNWSIVTFVVIIWIGMWLFLP
jgi:hypothetical protein